MPRHHNLDDDDGTRELHPVAADEPIYMHQPRRQIRRVAVAYALAIIVCSGVAAWIATDIAHTRASEHTDLQLRILNADLNERRRANAEANARRDAQTSELLTLVCLLLDRAVPRDGQVEMFRARFGCDTGRPSLTPAPTPAPTPSPTVSQPQPRQSGRGGGNPVPGTRDPPTQATTPPASARTGTQAPHPTKPATPTPHPTPPLLCLDLPPLARDLCITLGEILVR